MMSRAIFPAMPPNPYLCAAANPAIASTLQSERPVGRVSELGSLGCIARITMSWDISVQDIPEGTQSPADIPDDFQPKPFGKRSDIITRIREAVPSADFSDPTWGKIDGPGFSIEVGMSGDELVQSFAFHVRGGDLAAHVVADILQHLGFRAFDPSSESGIFCIGADAADGLRRWRAYRNTVLRR